MTILAIDAGTSTIKAVVFDRAGRELYVARRDAPIARPHPAWSEQDMNVVWDRVCEAVREAVHAAPAIDAVAITAQGDGCWLVDEDGSPIRPALLWNDARAAPIVAEWLADGTIARSYAQNGSVTFPGLANALLRWLADSEPKNLAATAHILTCGGWLFRCMTGAVRGEFSDVFAPFVNAHSGDYSDALLALHRLESCRPKLPPILKDPTVAALSAKAGARVGLVAGTPVILAPYDVPSAVLGVGAREPGDAIAVLGTTFLCAAIIDRPAIDTSPSGCLVPLGLPDRWLRFHPTLAGMEVVHWAAHMLGLADGRDMIALAAQSPPGANGLTFLPYLSPAGERAPFLDPDARGSFTNLSLTHTRADLARAVLEGLCMIVRDCLDAVGQTPTMLRLSGGGTMSDMLCQMLADVTGVAAQRASSSELTCRGAALYATRALGDPDALATWQETPHGSWIPHSECHAFYDARFSEFRRIRDCMRSIWRAA